MTHRRRWSVGALALALVTTGACGDGGDVEGPDVSASDVPTDAGDGRDGDGATEPDPGGDISEPDADATTGPADPLPLRAPLPTPTDPLADSARDACGTFEDTRCVAGATERCALLDVQADTFVAPESSPLLARAHRFERWLDRYHAPDGMTANRIHAGATAPGTPEAEWGALEHFGRYDATGDSAIWTGVALNAAVLRYAHTGTDADLARLTQRMRETLTLFEVTGVPGYLARNHYYVVDPEAPRTDRFLLRPEADTFVLGDRDMPVDVAALEAGFGPDAPARYLPGGAYEAADGTTWEGTGYWHGRPSIDQYIGPLTAFAVGHHLLDDEDVVERITTHATCYLKRLRRIEVRNIQANPEALTALQAMLGGAATGDLEGDAFADLDTAVVYVHPQLNQSNAEAFDRSCPDTLSLEPAKIIDAAGDGFLLDAFELFSDYEQNLRPTGIDHYYAVDLSGPHALTLLFLAVLAYDLTGDEAYRDFALEELVGARDAIGIGRLSGAFLLPRWCRKFFSDHIFFTPLWGLMRLLDDGRAADGPELSELREDLEEIWDQALWADTMWNLRNHKFHAMYLGEVAAERAQGHAAAREMLERDLPLLGGNGGVLDDPRRGYTIDRQALLADLPEGVEAICPTEDERRRCEDGFALWGVQIPGFTITAPCQGVPGECTMEDGTCAAAMCSVGMPVEWRPWEGNLWEGHPFHIGRGFGQQGEFQAPGVDVIEAYWLARLYGVTDDGEGLVLAWEPTEEPCED